MIHVKTFKNKYVWRRKKILANLKRKSIKEYRIREKFVILKGNLYLHIFHNDTQRIYKYNKNHIYIKILNLFCKKYLVRQD